MADYLLDSGVLIRHLRGHQPTVNLLAQLALEGQLGLAAISRTEILVGMRDHEAEPTLRLLNALITYPLEASIADLAGHYLRRYRAQGLTLAIPDALIGSTAIYHGLTLVTYNGKHFPMPELRLYPTGGWL